MSDKDGQLRGVLLSKCFKLRVGQMITSKYLVERGPISSFMVFYGFIESFRKNPIEGSKRRVTVYYPEQHTLPEERREYELTRNPPQCIDMQDNSCVNVHVVDIQQGDVLHVSCMPVKDVALCLRGSNSEGQPLLFLWKSAEVAESASERDMFMHGKDRSFNQGLYLLPHSKGRDASCEAIYDCPAAHIKAAELVADSKFAELNKSRFRKSATAARYFLDNMQLGSSSDMVTEVLRLLNEEVLLPDEEVLSHRFKGSVVTRFEGLVKLVREAGSLVLEKTNVD